jgi:2-oxoglutarate dehydrogenase E1 component
MNQGAWYSSQHHIRRGLEAYPGIHLRYAGRDASASPAAGYMSLHARQQEELVRQALYMK